MALELQYDRSLYGVEHRAGPFPVTEELVKAFAKGTGETNAVFTEAEAARSAGHPGLLAPPTLCTIFVRQIQLPSIELKFGRNSMHASQRVQALLPIYAGDELSASSHLKNVYAKTGRTGTMVFVVWETTFTNQHGTVVAEVEESFARRE